MKNALPCGLAVILVLSSGLLSAAAPAETPRFRGISLPEERAKSGMVVREAFKSVAAVTRDSVVQFEVDDKAVAFGAVIDTNGLAVTKASELSEGKLTCTLADGRKAEAKWIAADEDNDVALVKVLASGLKPVTWASGEPAIGAWAISPGIAESPEAVGIVSTQQRRILPKQAIIGVRPDFNATGAKIEVVMPGFGADKAGIKVGDMILSVNGTPVKDAEGLVKTLRQYREGQIVKVRVQRDEEELDFSITMMPRDPEPPPRGAQRQQRMNRLGGELSRRAEGFTLAIQHDTVLLPWQCGGPLLNLRGEAIGLNIARAGRIASYAVPAELMKQIIGDLTEKTELPVGKESKPPRDS